MSGAVLIAGTAAASALLGVLVGAWVTHRATSGNRSPLPLLGRKNKTPAGADAKRRLPEVRT